jgi:endo-1,4-beta-xylanase
MTKHKFYIPFFTFGLLLISSVGIFAQTTLKDAFKNRFLIGAALNQSQIFEKDTIGIKIVKTQFNTISPENILKWELVHPEPNRYDFEAADRYVALGEKYGMFVVGHTLVWHIQKVVGRYKGKIKGWDVVNEALNEDGTLRQSLWLKIIGEDYIAKAFEFAREADPTAELYYNDYSLENEPKRRGAINLVKSLQAKGIPIKAIGSQGHNNLTFPTLEQQDATISEFAKLGIKVNITELDVSVLPDPEGFSGAEVTLNFEMDKKLNPYKNGLPDEMQKKLADRYAALFRIFLKHHQTIDRITFWNVTDGDSWLNNFPVRGRTNYPLLFDRKGLPKPAFEAIIKTID